jgi:hypothetical protein
VTRSRSGPYLYECVPHPHGIGRVNRHHNKRSSALGVPLRPRDFSIVKKYPSLHRSGKDAQNSACGCQTSAPLRWFIKNPPPKYNTEILASLHRARMSRKQDMRAGAVATMILGWRARDKKDSSPAQLSRTASVIAPENFVNSTWWCEFPRLSWHFGRFATVTDQPNHQPAI